MAAKRLGNKAKREFLKKFRMQTGVRPMGVVGKKVVLSLGAAVALSESFRRMRKIAKRAKREIRNRERKHGRRAKTKSGRRDVVRDVSGDSEE